MSNATALRASYFGKLPGRGDFLKSADNNHQLIAGLDHWAGKALEMLSHNMTWKQDYDRGQAIYYAVMGSRHRHVIAGHVLPSTDASGRRFPFITAVTPDIAEPLPFIARSPLALSRVWTRLQTAVNTAHQAPDPTSPLSELANDKLLVNRDPAALDSTFNDFLDQQTIESLQSLISTPSDPAVISRLLTGLGLLLQPIMSAGPAGIGKGLLLPLPSEPKYQHLVAGFWMDLVAGFVGRADFELLIMMRSAAPSQLAIGFNGLQSDQLAAMFNYDLQQAHFIPLIDPDWVEDHIKGNAGLKKLAAYADNPGLSLQTARQTFRETFLGA